MFKSAMPTKKSKNPLHPHNIVRMLKHRFWGRPLNDAMGGLMAAIVALPLCLAFGVASGLGAAAGLYGAIACGIFSAAFGGTPGQCSGPTGPMTVVAAGIYAANPDRPELVFAVVIAAGLFQIGLGYLGAARLIYYLPFPVLSGFMIGIGVIIVCIQIAPLFGLPGSSNVLDALHSSPEIFRSWNKDALIVGAVTFACIYGLPRISKRIPGSLVGIAASLWLCSFFNLNVPRIGEIPSELPVPHIPKIHFDDVHTILQGGLTIAVLGSIDTLLTSIVMDTVTRVRHNGNQELRGQGIGNIVSGLFGGIPGSGATMRTMINVKAGGRTYLSGTLHGLILLAVLLGLGQIAGQIPLATLAAILVSVGISIMDWRVIKGLRKAPKADTAVMALVLVLTVFVDLIMAVFAGVALASVLFVKQLADAHASGVTDMETLEELRALADHVPKDVRESVFIYEFTGPLFFGAAKNLSASMEKLGTGRYIILRFNNVPLMDQSGSYALENAIEVWESKGIKVLFVGLPPHIQDTLERTGAIHKIDMQNCFEHFEDAIAAIDAFESQKSEVVRDSGAE